MTLWCRRAAPGSSPLTVAALNSPTGALQQRTGGQRAAGGLGCATIGVHSCCSPPARHWPCRRCATAPACVALRRMRAQWPRSLCDSSRADTRCRGPVRCQEANCKVRELADGAGLLGRGAPMAYRLPPDTGRRCAVAGRGARVWTTVLPINAPLLCLICALCLLLKTQLPLFCLQVATACGWRRRLGGAPLAATPAFRCLRMPLLLVSGAVYLAK